MTFHRARTPDSQAIFDSPEIQAKVKLSWIDPDTGKMKPYVTKQADKKQTDINEIIRRYDKTGLITHVNTMQAWYPETPNQHEYKDALNLVMKAQEEFMNIPSDIRKRFDNDPGSFLEFVTDPKNIDELVEMGLANPPPAAPAAAPAPTVDPVDDA